MSGDEPIPVLYRDDEIVVVAKPAGMLVHRDAMSRTFERVLLNTLRDQIGAYVYPVHRLDRNTSGCVVFGLSSVAARELQASLTAPDATKAYVVLARGLTPDRFESERPLRNHAGEPRPSKTSFETITRFDLASLITAELGTGRHHQIRRHLNHLAHHVIGDTTHGKGRINRQFREEYGLPRMFLHGWRVEMTHPSSGERLLIRAPLAADLVAVLGRLQAPDRIIRDLTSSG